MVRLVRAPRRMTAKAPSAARALSKNTGVTSRSDSLRLLPPDAEEDIEAQSHEVQGPLAARDARVEVLLT